jgi:hypothetical protein
VQLFGYPALGLGAIVISVVAVVVRSRVCAARGAAALASLEIA